MAIAADHLVGRAEELGALDAALEDAGRGRARAAVVLGDAGIGKTRLLAELAERADARGYLVLTGAASELERALPFWVFVDALDDYVRSLDPERLARLDPGLRERLAHVLPGLPGERSAEPPRDERYLTHVAVRALLELLAAQQPLVLVLDDLHWADPGSIDQLAGLLRRPPASPLLVALAMRPRQAPPRLVAAVARAEAERRVTRLELGVLTRAQARELVGAAAEAQGLYEESGGNPFYLEQLARGLGRTGHVPSGVSSALAEELALLPDGARRLLEGAAVAGDPFEPDLAAAAAGVEEMAALELLDDLQRADLVHPTEVPRRFRFRHPLVRHAVYEAAPAGWRLGADARCAEALAARGASPGARAQHLERCAAQGDMAAIAVLREAAAAAALTAPATAAGWLGAALRLLPDAARRERVGLLLARAGALVAAGRLEDGRGLLLESLALVPEDALTRRVELITLCATVEHLLGRHEDAHIRLKGALDALPAAAGGEAVALMLSLGLDGFYRGQFEALIEWGERALAAAERLADPVLVAAARATVAAGATAVASREEGDARLDEAAAAVAALSDAQVARRLDALAYTAMAQLYADRFADAIACAERALRIASATFQRDRFPQLISVPAAARRIQGDLAQSAALLDAAIETARLAGNTHALAFNLFNRVFTAAWAGDLDSARALAQEATELARGLDASVVDAWIAAGLGMARLLDGDPQGTLDALASAGSGEGLSGLPGTARGYALELLVRAHLQLGHQEEAAAAARWIGVTAAGRRLPTAIGRRAEALVALAAGDHAAAVDHARASIAGCEAVGARYDVASGRLLAGRALAAGGETERALAELEAAAAAFGEFGALRLRDEAERELRALGRRVYRRTATATASGLESLTERELEVARLVVDRRTNGEIAATLFLSKKTVETHLRNIFAKLGVSSRVELARTVERADG